MKKGNKWDSNSQKNRADLLIKWGKEDDTTYGPSNAKKHAKEINNKKLQERITSYNKEDEKPD